jgi:polyphosphate kinase 2 (PPK2 family)
MLEKVNLKLSLSKAECQRRLSHLQNRLYDLEHAIYQAGIPVAIVSEGWAAAGKGSTIRVLAERMDPRGFRVVSITPPRTAELQYPWLWRFWQKIPACGQIIVYDTSWYRRVLIDRVAKNVRKQEWQGAFQDISEFEEQLAADGTVILKFWLHISKREQSRRFKKLLKNNLTAWQVSDEDAAQHKAYKKYSVAVEEMLARTDSPQAPWTIVEATDRHFCRIKVIETIVRALERRLGDHAPPPSRVRVKKNTGSSSAPPKVEADIVS